MNVCRLRIIKRARNGRCLEPRLRFGTLLPVYIVWSPVCAGGEICMRIMEESA